MDCARAVGVAVGTVFGAVVKPVQGLFNLGQGQFILTAGEVASLKKLQPITENLE